MKTIYYKTSKGSFGQIEGGKLDPDGDITEITKEECDALAAEARAETDRQALAHKDERLKKREAALAKYPELEGVI